MKISVLTPTYNDSGSIEETLQSLIAQTYTNWEWIVVNDGSTDNTDEVIKTLIEKYGIKDKCKYIVQENADQLNAIINGMQYITGEYVFTLHSDDLLPENGFFEKCIKAMKENPDIDGLFGDLLIIDEKSNIAGLQKVKEYHVDTHLLPLMLLWLGRNLYSDVAFHKASIYKSAVKYNYLEWNMPLWLDINNEYTKMLHYKSVAFPMLKYRVHEANYANNELGQMNVINGELRTATELMKYFEIPNYRLQYIFFRFFNKIAPTKDFKVRYREKETSDKYSIVSYIISKRYPQGVEGNIFLQSVLQFYKKKSDRILNIGKLPEELKIYYGKDVRAFNKKILDNSLESFYVDFMKEMKEGFSAVQVEEEADVYKMEKILKFLCIGHVKVRRK